MWGSMDVAQTEHTNYVLPHTNLWVQCDSFSINCLQWNFENCATLAKLTTAVRVYIGRSFPHMELQTA